VVLEGLFVKGSRVGLGCSGSDASVQIVRSFFSGNATAISASGGCQLSVSESWLGSGPAGSGFAGLPGNARGVEISGADFRIENSVFVDSGDYRQDALGGVRVRSLGLGATRSSIVNTTFYQQQGLIKNGKYLTSLLCDVAVSDRLVLLNNLFFGDQPLLTSPEEHPIDPACGTWYYHLGSNDSTLTANGSVILPSTPSLFVDARGRDLRPTIGGDVARTALARGGIRSQSIGNDVIAAPSGDLDGQTRGQTAGQTENQVAIGAFEPVLPVTP
jgi:hypothetical protein